ncbi:MAG: hypothetical protein VYE68_15110 [Acidobacteriota bacterium]|nr:hypothetical protein [Acidobacteriota bacterium]
MRLRNEVQTDGRPLANGGSAVGADGTDPGVVTGRFLTAISTVVRVRAVKLYRLRIQPLPHVPALPCLDHEAMLHEGIAPHVAAYVEDLERAELHEVVLIPSRRRVEIDVASTWQEHTEDGQQRLIAALREHVPECAVSINDLSWLRGDRRVARACRAQVTLRDVLVGADLDEIDRALHRLRTIAALMEKQSRVASWSVRTVTGPFLAVAGFVVYRGLGQLAPEVGAATVRGLQALVVGAAGALFLYYGLKAVHLTEMANRVWKRASEYSLIVSERRRLKSTPVATSTRHARTQ